MMQCGSTPHPNPLPKGEGALAEPAMNQAFLLPWGEGQDEGLSRKLRLSVRRLPSLIAAST